MFNEEIWNHVIVKPCYVLAPQFESLKTEVLITLWEESLKSMDSKDMEDVAQAWQCVMALRKVFEERMAWSNKHHKPIKPMVGKPMWITNGIEPGTPEWIEHWKNYPEEQPSMCKHVTRKNNLERRDPKYGTIRCVS